MGTKVYFSLFPDCYPFRQAGLVQIRSDSNYSSLPYTYVYWQYFMLIFDPIEMLLEKICRDQERKYRILKIAIQISQRN